MPPLPHYVCVRNCWSWWNIPKAAVSISVPQNMFGISYSYTQFAIVHLIICMCFSTFRVAFNLMLYHQNLLLVSKLVSARVTDTHCMYMMVVSRMGIYPHLTVFGEHFICYDPNTSNVPPSKWSQINWLVQCMCPQSLLNQINCLGQKHLMCAQNMCMIPDQMAGPTFLTSQPAWLCTLSDRGVLCLQTLTSGSHQQWTGASLKNS